MATLPVCYGIMALVLAGGDASIHTTDFSHHNRPARTAERISGRGKQITSITMTLFYVLLWHVGVNFISNKFKISYSPNLYPCNCKNFPMSLLKINGLNMTQITKQSGVTSSSFFKNACCPPFLLLKNEVEALVYVIAIVLSLPYLLWFYG